jgi:Ca2+-binding EF-hand superfamily protein
MLRTCPTNGQQEIAMKTKFLFVAAALVSLAGVAAEQTATPAGHTGSFDTLDANKDGRISMPEASADPSLVEMFSTADKNGDGYLDNAEYDNSVAKNRK